MTVLKVNSRPAKTWNGIVNDLFADFDQNFGRYANSPAIPPANIYETTSGYHLELFAPGRKKENFSLQVEKDSLTLACNEQDSVDNGDIRQVRKEFSTAAFKRVFSIGDQISKDGIAAKYEDGLLKVYLPKKEEVKPVTKQISIQ